MASITFDLGAISIKHSGTTLVTPVADPKYIPFVSSGDIIRLRLYATVTGTDPSKPQTLQSATGSLLSTFGGLKGDFKTTRISSNAANTGTVPHLSLPWNGPGSSTGLAQDLDVDGDLDLGSNNDAATANFVAYRSDKLQGPRSNNASGISDYFSPGTTPTTTGASTTYVLSTQIDFLVTNGPPPEGGIGALLNWRPSASQPSVWFEDASETATDVNGDGSVLWYTYSGGTPGSSVLVGAPVILVVPEPATSATALSVGFLLASRRRLGARCS